MSEKSNNVRKVGSLSKIESNDLVKQTIDMLMVTPKMSYKEIAQSLNTIAGLEGDTEDVITSRNVQQFASNYPDLRKEILLANRAHMRKLVLEGAEFDMLYMLKDLASRLTFMIDTMEESALEEGNLPDAKEYKALTSELRETLKQIESIHKEVYDMEVVREFLLEVVKTLKDVSPGSLEEFIKRLKGKRENSHIVSDILKGGNFK